MRNFLSSIATGTLIVLAAVMPAAVLTLTIDPAAVRGVSEPVVAAGMITVAVTGAALITAGAVALLNSDGRS